MKKKLIIIGIESSCDETAVSIIKNRYVLSNIIIHQEIHKKYGGVVPELASRLHDKNLPIAVRKAIHTAKINQNEIDAVSFTLGPGLIGSLLVGTSFAKSLSMGLGKPLLTVNHIQAHILTHFIKNANINNNYPKFPFLSLVISGGHTQIIKVNDFFQMKILGSTLDDSVGEVLDKIAIKLGFYYPGGPMIEFFSKNGNCKKFGFSKPYVKKLNFSFSGFKNHVLQFIKKKSKDNPCFIKENLSDLCASIQKIVAEILLEKVQKATINTDIFRIVLAGGVSSNNEIRKTFISFAEKNKKWEIFIPKNQYTTDNGAMVAITGLLKYKKKLFDSIHVTPYSKFKIF
ncbi:tRNA (adenosine(37)-N6)-threonylcarbamoyltransferase complex transferase subunit TsaD [Blattabacterium cuenoti]|uniref:tRNA (adenosine(37)-N6)-threonylcarbamoyltransferase complex transferase subunit TsaD n=1 Tax=Blattabacterium cuenoti TaxID=1653831 RepID=UPI00163D19CB|nr:tRNA (adenosine(37)-N6)-threonylcarbamoyltransferase complex transferase subunit TsaD [Blattabacterium cuenoti]